MEPTQNAFATILERLSHIGATVEHIKHDVARINGRINALERWQAEEIKEHAYQRGQDEARKDAVVTKGQLAAIGMVAGLISAVAGIAVRFL